MSKRHTLAEILKYSDPNSKVVAKIVPDLTQQRVMFHVFAR